jgi:hypothetical protein
MRALHSALLNLWSQAAMGLLFASCGGPADSARTPDAAATQLASPCDVTPRQIVRAFWTDPTDAGVPFAMPSHLAIAGDSLFLAGNENASLAAVVWRISVQDGTYATFLQLNGEEDALLLTSTDLVVAESHAADATNFAGDVIAAPLSGDPPRVLAQTVNRVRSMVADGETVYFTDANGAHTVALADGIAQSLSSTVGTLGVFNHALIIADDSAGTLTSVPATGSPSTVLATNQPGAANPLTCGQAVCWTTAVPQPEAQGVGAIVQMSPGAMPSTLSQGAELFQPAVALFDGQSFFVASAQDAVSGLSVERVPAAGGDPVFVSQIQTSGLASDASCLYLADSNEGVFVVSKDAMVSAVSR